MWVPEMSDLPNPDSADTIFVDACRQFTAMLRAQHLVIKAMLHGQTVAIFNPKADAGIPIGADAGGKTVYLSKLRFPDDPFDPFAPLNQTDGRITRTPTPGPLFPLGGGEIVYGDSNASDCFQASERVAEERRQIVARLLSPPCTPLSSAAARTIGRPPAILIIVDEADAGGVS
jgi:hypothetical protein